MTGHTERKRSASYRNEMKMLHIVEWNETMLHRQAFMKHFVSCTPLACQAHKSMKRHVVPWSAPAVHEAKPDGFMFFCPSGQKKRKLSFFIFSSYERSECFIAEWNEAASYCGAVAKQCFIVRLLWSTLCLARLWRVKHTKVWSGTLCHEAHLRCTKRSLTASCFFALKSRQKNGRPFLLNSENSPTLKWLQVNQSWSSLRQTVKISLFLPFYATENTFQLNRKDFFSETNAKSLKKR